MTSMALSRCRMAIASGPECAWTSSYLSLNTASSATKFAGVSSTASTRGIEEMVVAMRRTLQLVCPTAQVRLRPVRENPNEARRRRV